MVYQHFVDYTYHFKLKMVKRLYLIFIVFCNLLLYWILPIPP